MGLPPSTAVNPAMDRTSTGTVTASAASPTVDDEEDRSIRIEVSVLTAILAFAVMAHLLLWLRS